MMRATARPNLCVTCGCLTDPPLCHQLGWRYRPRTGRHWHLVGRHGAIWGPADCPFLQVVRFQTTGDKKARTHTQRHAHTHTHTATHTNTHAHTHTQTHTHTYTHTNTHTHTHTDTHTHTHTTHTRTFGFHCFSNNPSELDLKMLNN